MLPSGPVAVAVMGYGSSCADWALRAETGRDVALLTGSHPPLIEERLPLVVIGVGEELDGEGVTGVGVEATLDYRRAAGRRGGGDDREKVPQGVGMLREAGVAPPAVSFLPVKPPITATTVP